MNDSMTPEEAMQQLKKIKTEFESLDNLSQIKVAAYVYMDFRLSDAQAFSVLKFLLSKHLFSLCRDFLFRKDDE